MHNGTGQARPAIDHAGCARTIRTLVDDHEGVIHGIAGLKAMGDEAASALRQVLGLPSIRKLRHSWELFEALADGDGVDPDGYLISEMGLDRFDWAHGVIFNVERPVGLHLVQA